MLTRNVEKLRLDHFMLFMFVPPQSPGFVAPLDVQEWSSTELSFSASSSCSVSLNFSVVNITGIVSM